MVDRPKQITYLVRRLPLVLLPLALPGFGEGAAGP